ncbi:MAG: hypothetical protein N2578_08065, partial [Bdellovibrionaceae bacterium]|nr:hypothetical protein [Pseudobdellovibrionaceae bacterium]
SSRTYRAQVIAKNDRIYRVALRAFPEGVLNDHVGKNAAPSKETLVLTIYPEDLSKGYHMFLAKLSSRLTISCQNE